jgi:membrane protease subunit (stomatin/prohibitin family)
MALIDVIKYEDITGDALSAKWNQDEIRLGAQLIVGEGQEAVFVKGGQAFDTFGPGTYTLSSENLPLLNKIVNLPFGGSSPFSAEIWFFSTIVRRDIPWGTPSPIQILDPNINIAVSVRSFGRYGFRVSNSRSFLGQLVGNSANYTVEQLRHNLSSEIIQRLKDHIAELVISGMSVLKIGTHLNEISVAVQTQLNLCFSEYGIDFFSFNVESINIPEQELSQINSVLLKTFEARELSATDITRNYQAIKTMEILRDAANNTADSGMGALLGAGLGLGVGLPIGKELSHAVSIKTEETNASDDLVSRLKKLKILHEEGFLTDTEYQAKRDELIALL